MTPAIRAMTAEDLPAFERLTRLREGLDEAAAHERTRVIEHLAFRNPHGDGAPTYFVAHDGDELLVHLGRMPTRFVAGSREIRGAWAHDLFAHPELRATGRGFFATMRLYRALEDATEGFCGLAWTNTLNVELQRSRGARELWVRRRVRPLDARKLADALALRGAARTVTLRASRRVASAIDRTSTALRSLRRRTGRIDQFGPAFDTLAARVGPRLGIAPRKDAAYRRWKDLEHPALRVAIYEARAGRELAGFTVLRERRTPSEPGRLLELVADPADTRTLASLVGAALAHYARDGADRVESLATDPSIARALARALFVERPPALPLFHLRGERIDEPRLMRLDGWHHSFGDSEGGEVI